MTDIDKQIEQLTQLNNIISNRKIINMKLVHEFIACGYAKSNNGFSSLTKSGESALKALLQLNSQNTDSI
jgi:hypothetical protein